MRIIKVVWVATLLVLFFVVSSWYGGNGKPLSPEEGEALLEKFREAYSEPGSEAQNLLANLEQMIPNDDGKEFYAVNLEKLKQGEVARQADIAYSQTVMPLLFKRAGHPVLVSRRVGLMLGNYGNQVDRVIVVRYRSLKDLINMTIEPSMIAGSDNKFASLDHTEVFITRPQISFLTVRLVFCLFLFVLGLAGWKILSLISRDTK